MFSPQTMLAAQGSTVVPISVEQADELVLQGASPLTQTVCVSVTLKSSPAASCSAPAMLRLPVPWVSTS
jgi:hypothetical protein